MSRANRNVRLGLGGKANGGDMCNCTLTSDERKSIVGKIKNAPAAKNANMFGQKPRTGKSIAPKMKK